MLFANVSPIMRHITSIKQKETGKYGDYFNQAKK